MWAASYLLVGDLVLDSTTIHRIHFKNQIPKHPNAILIQVSGQDWYGRPMFFTCLECKRIAIDFASGTGEMPLLQQDLELNAAEKQEIRKVLKAKAPRAWNHKKSAPIRQLLQEVKN